MQPMRGEDLLEAILLMDPIAEVTVPRIASELSCSPEELESIIRDLLREGLVHLSPEGTLILTEQGRRIAEQVARKHRILQEFLTEMLGVSPREASQEACRLEHHISDEVTHRLSDYIRQRGLKKVRRRGSPGTSLLDHREGDLLVIREIPPGVRRLMDLGFIPGEQIRLCRKLKNRAVVVTVKGCDVALSPEVAALVFVEKTS